MDRGFALAGQLLPELLGGEDEYRRRQPGQRVGYDIESGLGRAAPGRIGGRAVQPVLQHVQVNGRQVHRAEVVHQVVHPVELQALVGLRHPLRHLGQPVQRPAVDFEKPGVVHGVHRGVEVVEVAEQKTPGVADAAVGVGVPPEYLVPQADVAPVVGRRGPQAQDVGPVLPDDGLGQDGVAEALVHRAPLRVQHPAVRQHPAVGRLTLQGHAGQQRDLEPAAVLVAPLEVYVRGPGEAVIGALEHGEVAHAALEPHVEDVGLAPEPSSPALRTHQPRRDEALDGLGEPGVRALLGRDIPRQGGHPRVQYQLAAPRAVQPRNRHPPSALAREAPVRSQLEHVGHALPPPDRDPLHPVHRLQAPLPQVVTVHVQEPLLGGAEYHRLLAPPAVRVRVHELPGPQERAVGPHVLEDGRVGLEHTHTRPLLNLGGEAPGVVHRNQHRQAVLASGAEVLGAVTRSGVDQPRALLQGHVVGGYEDRIPLQERVAAHQPQQLLALDRFQLLSPAPAQVADDLVRQALGEEVTLTGVLHHEVAQTRVDRDGNVGRQGPGGGGPDDGVRPVEVMVEDAGRVAGHRKADVDGVARVVFVLHLGVGQRRLATGAPEHRAEPLVDVTLLHQAPEGFQHRGLVVAVGGQVGLFPEAEDAQALELAAHGVHETEREAAALPAHVTDGHLPEFFTQLPRHLVLDGHAVAVPAGHVGGVETAHRLVLDDDVLEDLVQRGSGVDLAVGVRRPVVEDVLAPTLRLLPQQRINAQLLPAGQSFRLPRGQAGPHGEIGARQVERILVGLLPHSRALRTRGLNPLFI